MPSWFGNWFGVVSEDDITPGVTPGVYLISDLINEARVLIDDDHTEDTGWVKEARWVRWLNWEMRTLAERCLKMGLVRTPVTELDFTGPATTGAALSGVMEILNVVDPDGNELEAVQPDAGVAPFWDPVATGPARYWMATGGANTLVVTLSPQDSRTYTVRYVPQTTYATAATDYVSVPQGFEERLVLGMARYALVKEGRVSVALERRLEQADATIAFSLFGKVRGPVVRRLPRSSGPRPRTPGR